MNPRPLILSLRRGLATLTSRKLYLAMFLVPLAMTFFFINLMSEGLPLRTPVAVVDLDHSSLSRAVTRNLNASELLAIDEKPEDFHAALAKVRKGEIFGFFLIPHDFQQRALSGRAPTLTFYSNMTYFVPGTLSFKGFKTVAVTTTAGVVMTELSALGISENVTSDLLQPVAFQTHQLGNPWTNYSIYLSNSFVPGVLALMVLLMTAYTVCDEIKNRTSPEWLSTAGGSMIVALTGKLLPQTIIWSVIGIGIQATLYGWCHFPLNNHALHMVAAIILLVIGSQSFALIITEAIPNLRLSLSINSLVGILSFSLTGFSFPVQSMYGAMGIFSYIIPLRYYFLIYVDQALNGIPIYYSRYYYVALLAFPVVALIGLRRLRGRCLRPVYVP